MARIAHCAAESGPSASGFDERKADDAFGVAEALQRAMRVDPVTQLPNRKRFVEDFGFGLSTMPHSAGEVLAMLTLAEPAQYTSILRALGHGFAEEFVRLGADRLRGALPEDIPLYHVSSLGFAFPLQTRDGDAEAMALVREIAAVFAHPLFCAGIPIRNRVGIGLTPLSGAVMDPSELLRGALVAAQDSHESAEDWAWYDRSSDQAHLRAFRLLADLGRLIDGPVDLSREQLSLVYQPRIDLKSGHCIGAEALMRWSHPALGAVPPLEFIPLAEATALITPLTRWVIAEAVAQCAEWHRDGIDLTMSMNVSPDNLSEPDFAEFLLETCAEHRVDPRSIEIEFTESTVTTDSALTLQQLTCLREAGIAVAIDDFGSGYSNMRYLRSIPADTLKIDRDFIMTLDHCDKNRKIVPTIIDLAHRLDFRVVAEGIETQNAYDAVRDWGCDEGQGYWMSRPLCEEEFRNWYLAHAIAA